jgi:Xaa-Pro dipeptidase
VGVEETTRFFAFDGLRQLGFETRGDSGVVRACRLIKSPAEIALMQRATDITLQAIGAAFKTMKEGMTNQQLGAAVAEATRKLGGNADGALVIFGKYTAFPHGSIQPQRLKEGDVVLIDAGCTVDGYTSDITRTTVFGKPTQRQRDIWEFEKAAQSAALAAAQVGATCESVDAAARKVLVAAGFGPGYKTPGLPHRTGHGIGLDGHEWTNFVRGNTTRLAPGMCFSDEPTIVIYGEFGIRLEDCLHMTADGPKLFTPQAASIERPV